MTGSPVHDRVRYPNDFELLEPVVRRCKELVHRASSPKGSPFDLDRAAQLLQNIYDFQPASVVPLPELNWIDLDRQPIYDLDLTVRLLAETLVKQGCSTIADLMLYTKDELSEIRDLGGVSISDIEQALEKRGLRLLSPEERAHDPALVELPWAEGHFGMNWLVRALIPVTSLEAVINRHDELEACAAYWLRYRAVITVDDLARVSDAQLSRYARDDHRNHLPARWSLFGPHEVLGRVLEAKGRILGYLAPYLS